MQDTRLQDKQSFDCYPYQDKRSFDCAYPYDDFLIWILTMTKPFGDCYVKDNKIDLYAALLHCYPEKLTQPVILPSLYRTSIGPHDIYFENLTIGAIAHENSVVSCIFKNVQFNNYTSQKSFPNRFEDTVFYNTRFENMILPDIIFSSNSRLYDVQFNNVTVNTFRIDNNSRIYQGVFNNMSINDFHIDDENYNANSSYLYGSIFNHVLIQNFQIGSLSNGVNNSLFNNTQIKVLKYDPPAFYEEAKIALHSRLINSTFNYSTIYHLDCEACSIKDTIFDTCELNHLTIKDYQISDSMDNTVSNQPVSLYSDIQNMQFIHSKIKNSSFSGAFANDMIIQNSTFIDTTLKGLRFNITNQHCIDLTGFNNTCLSKPVITVTSDTQFYDSSFCWPQTLEGKTLSLAQIPGANNLTALKHAPDTYCHGTRDRILISVIVPLGGLIMLGALLFALRRQYTPEAINKREKRKELKQIKTRQTAMLISLSIYFSIVEKTGWKYLPKHIVFHILKYAMKKSEQKILVDDEKMDTYDNYLTLKFPNESSGYPFHHPSYTQQRNKWIAKNNIHINELIDAVKLTQTKKYSFWQAGNIHAMKNKRPKIKNTMYSINIYPENAVSEDYNIEEPLIPKNTSSHYCSIL